MFRRSLLACARSVPAYLTTTKPDVWRKSVLVRSECTCSCFPPFGIPKQENQSSSKGGDTWNRKVGPEPSTPAKALCLWPQFAEAKEISRHTCHVDKCAPGRCPVCLG